MSDEHFLARWSRRKRDVAAAEASRETSKQESPQDAPANPNRTTGQPVVAVRNAEATLDETQAAAAQTPAAFDRASLPDLESITSTTDVRGFLGPQVPPALTRAALRRAWVADPAIRDFVGLQENDWDFNNPNSIPGFGDLGSEQDLKNMVARVFNEAPDAAERPADPPDQPVAATDESISGDGPDAVRTAAIPSQDTGEPDPPSGTDDPVPGTVMPPRSEELLRRTTDVASQHGDLVASTGEKTHRFHGGALPKS
jgi:hypothetical protein